MIWVRKKKKMGERENPTQHLEKEEAETQMDKKYFGDRLTVLATVKTK